MHPIALRILIALGAIVLVYLANRFTDRKRRSDVPWEHRFPLMRRDLTFWDYFIAIVVVAATVLAGWFWPK